MHAHFDTRVVRLSLQMGGIDESALDRLSLVTEMTRHIRVRAGGGGVLMVPWWLVAVVLHNKQ